jgi:hypothetical protein
MEFFFPRIYDIINETTLFYILYVIQFYNTFVVNEHVIWYIRTFDSYVVFAYHRCRSSHANMLALKRSKVNMNLHLCMCIIINYY